jgi:hypothetical protein
VKRRSYGLGGPSPREIVEEPIVPEPDVDHLMGRQPVTYPSMRDYDSPDNLILEHNQNMPYHEGSAASPGRGCLGEIDLRADVGKDLLELDLGTPDNDFAERWTDSYSDPNDEAQSNIHLGAGLPAVGDAARRLAGDIAREIERVQAEYGIAPMEKSKREFAQYWESDLTSKAKAARVDLLRARSRGLMEYLPAELVRTDAARQRLAPSRIFLADEREMPDAAGQLDARSGHISLRITVDHMLAPIADNVGAFESTLAHEIRHAIDWAYTGKAFTEKRHPGGQQQQEARTRAWWTAYISNPTELMAWAGNVAYKLDHKPRGWEDLRAMLAGVTVKVIDEGVRAAQVGTGVVDVPVIDLLRPEDKPRFLQMILKAYDQLHPAGGEGVNPWHLRREDTVNRKKIPPAFVSKILEYGYLQAVREGMIDREEYPSWQAWVQNNDASQLAMVLENNYAAYQFLRQLPKNQLGEYPDLTDMIDRFKRGARRADTARPPWVAVDLDGTVLEAAPKGVTVGEGQQLPLGPPKPGAVDALTELVRLGWRVSIFSARFGDENLDDAVVATWAKEIAEHLTRQNVPFTDIWVGRKPRCDFFVDDKAIKFDGDWGSVIEQLTLIDAPPRDPVSSEVDEREGAGGPLDYPANPNDFNDPTYDQEARGVNRPPEFEEALFGHAHARSLT